jgi:hypothetical protein
MVIHVVGDPRQSIDEANTVREPVERKCLRECPASARPTGKPPERTLNLEIGEFLSHIASLLRVDRRWRFYTAPSVRAIVASGLLLAGTAPCRAQDSTVSPTTSRAAYWRRFTAGAITSILLHEAGHVVTSFAVGGRPSFGFDELRPTIYSGIDARIEPHKQFLFSASGLTVQTLLDEAILDIPHDRGGIFERGLLGGGIGTTLFYLTIGRNGSVSDVDFMARTHALTKTQVTLLFGSIVAMHSIRIAHDPEYANFFARESPDGQVHLGVEIRR